VPSPAAEGREDSLAPGVVGGATHALTSLELVRGQLGGAQTDRLHRLRVSQIQDVLQEQVVAIERTRQEVRRVAALATRKPLELVNDGLPIKPQIEHREAVRRIPPSTMDPGTAPRQWVIRRRKVPERVAAMCNSAQPVNAGNQLGDQHGLDEHALGHRIDGSEHWTGHRIEIRT
jgi:hypothetical protein